MPDLLPDPGVATILGLVLLALTASLLFFANMEGAGELGRPAAALSLISLAGGIVCMFLAYTGKDDEFPAFDGETVAAPARPKPPAFVMPMKPKAPADETAALPKKRPAQEAAAAPAQATQPELVAAEDARVPGEAFKECPECPVMVVLPTGYFQLGAAASDEDASAAEKPQRGAVIRRPVAMAQTEITNGQYAAFLSASGRTAVACGGSAAQADGGRPASCISYRDAHEYAGWLSRRTGQRYRLATAAEWEFAARAGSTDRLAGGATAPAAAVGLGPVPVAGSHGNNAFGLADMGGSLAEITADCVVVSLEHAPTDGSAAGETGDCARRIVKDASWREPAARARASARRAIAVEAHSDGVGFRVVRDMARRTAARP